MTVEADPLAELVLLLADAGVCPPTASTAEIVEAIRGLVAGRNETIEGLEEEITDWQDFAETRNRTAASAEQALEAERWTLIKVAAIAEEYLHVLEHVAACEATCPDCRTLAQGALAHENLPALLAEGYLPNLETARVRLAAERDLLETDVMLLREQADRNQQRILELEGAVRRARRASRRFVRLALEGVAERIGVSPRWEAGNRENRPVGVPKYNGRLVVEIWDAVTELRAILNGCPRCRARGNMRREDL